jgi:hypothetical protein
MGSSAIAMRLLQISGPRVKIKVTQERKVRRGRVRILRKLPTLVVLGAERGKVKFHDVSNTPLVEPYGRGTLGRLYQRYVCCEE